MANPSPPMPAYKSDFLESCLSGNVLTFGSYTLKSGRQSPYFFNAGSFHSAPLLHSISDAYAHAILAFLAAHPAIPQPDVIFGPAYKGVPLACCTLLQLHRHSPAAWAGVSYAFNRKEAKRHGEGGSIVGASLAGKDVLVIDDVITAGTAMRETLELVGKEGGRVVGFVVALDRMEKMPGEGEGRSAMGQIRREYGVPTSSVVTLDDLIGLMRVKGRGDEVEKMEAYRERYLAND